MQTGNNQREHIEFYKDNRNTKKIYQKILVFLINHKSWRNPNVQQRASKNECMFSFVQNFKPNKAATQKVEINQKKKN